MRRDDWYITWQIEGRNNSLCSEGDEVYNKAHIFADWRAKCAEDHFMMIPQRPGQIIRG